MAQRRLLGETVAPVDLRVAPWTRRLAGFQRIREPPQERNRVVPSLDGAGQDEAAERAA